METLKQQLIRHEGLRLKPYKDTVGKLTIGVGRNLDDKGISAAEADIMLDNDIAAASAEVAAALPWTASLDECRRNVLVNMCFNMGIQKLLEFHRTLHAVETGDFVAAANNMLDSKWASQVGSRAEELARQMREGK